jgi:hypothetical protein
MASIGHHHSKCEVQGCKGRRPVWSHCCKAHREIYGNRPPGQMLPPVTEKQIDSAVTFLEHLNGRGLL